MTLRSWATPLVIGTFLAAGVTGVLMFFHLDSGVNKLLHEWIGLAMIAGVLAHVMLNWRAFTTYFRRPMARAIMALGVVLLGLSFLNLPGLSGGPGATVGKVMGALGGAEVTLLADLAGTTPEALVATLTEAGFEGAAPGAKVGALAGGDRERQMRILELAFAGE